jgi:SSS family solute:Na+ symporter
MEGQGVILAGVGIYLVAMLVIGSVAARRAKTTSDFILAGRELSLPLATSTLLATWMGAGTIIGAAGAAYTGGVYATIADPFGAGLCLLIAGMFFVRILRRMRLLTIIDLFEIKYGRHATIIAALTQLVAFVGWVGSQLVAFGFILHALTGVPEWVGIVAATVIVLAYTTAGGMWAVALTDAVQLGVMLIGLVLIVPDVVGEFGGWEQLTAAVDSAALQFMPAENGFNAWTHYLSAWFVIGIGSLTGQDLMQRALSSRNEAVAQNACYLAGFGYLTFGLIPVFLGVTGALLMPGLADPEYIVPELAQRLLSPVLQAVFVGALLSAIMSGADSALLAPASVMAENIAPMIRPDISDEQKLTVARWSVPILGVLSLGAALWAGTVYELMLDAFALELVAMVVPLIAAVWWPKANTTGALASLYCGGTCWAAALVWLPEAAADVLGMAGGIVALVVVSLLTQEIDRPRQLTDSDGNTVRLANRLGLIGIRADQAA